MKFLLSILSIVCILNSIYGQWEPMNGPYGGYINDLAKNDTYIFTATPHGIFRSNDEGATWNHLVIESGVIYACLQVAAYNNIIITDAVNHQNDQINRYLFKSVDNGDTWIKLPRPKNSNYFSIAVNEYCIYLTDISDLWVSLDQGFSWSHSHINNQLQFIAKLYLFDNQICFASRNKIYKTIDSTDHFLEIIVQGTEYVSSFFIFDSLIMAQGSDGKLFRSTDGGQSWISLNLNLNGWVNFAKIGNEYFINIAFTILKSTDNGLTWKDQNPTNYSSLVHLMISQGNTLITGALYKGIYSSKDNGKTFMESNFGVSATATHAVYATDTTLWTASVYSGISGYDITSSKWDSSFIFSATESFTDINSIAGNLVAVGGSKIYTSDKNGKNWTVSTSPFPIHYLYKYNRHSSGNHYLLAGGELGWNSLISQNGIVWGEFTIQIDGATKTSTLFAQNESTIFVANRKQIYRSFDDGITWSIAMAGLELKDNLSSIYKLYSLKGILYAIELNDAAPRHTRIYVSYDNGDTWNRIGSTLQIGDGGGGIASLIMVDDILIGTTINYTYGVYVSFDYGNSWEPFNDGFMFKDIEQLTFDSNYIYAGTTGQGVWRRKIADLYATGTQYLPTLQNKLLVYPNPAHNSFTIKMESPNSGEATLWLTDIKGQVLISREIELDRDLEIQSIHFVPGLYFITIQSGKSIYSQKIIILEQ